MRALPALSAALLLSACGVSTPPATPEPSEPPVNPPAAAKIVRFVAFGDAGQATQGGPAAQTAVGDAMAAVCAARGCDFALEFGDNFYLSGVQSVSDAQWQSKFELPYANLKVPVFATLGNHDNSQGPGEGSSNARGNFQVAYHAAAENVNKKWNMPARYYRFTAPLSSAGNDFTLNLPAGYPPLPTTPQTPLVEFFSLDSSPLTSIVADPNPSWNYLTYGPTHLQWFQQGLANSKAKWKIAFAHHPYVSNGLHGNAGSFDGTNPNLPGTTNGKPWKDFLDDSACAMGLDFFMFGHDHDIEWLKPLAGCGKTEFVLSGTSEQPRAFGDAARNPVHYQKDNVLAFFWFEFRDNDMTGAAYVLDAQMKLPLASDGKPQADFEQSLPRQP